MPPRWWSAKKRAERAEGTGGDEGNQTRNFYCCYHIQSATQKIPMEPLIKHFTTWETGGCSESSSSQSPHPKLQEQKESKARAAYQISMLERQAPASKCVFYLHIAMRVSFKHKLLLNGFGQKVKQCPGLWLKFAFPSSCLINNVMCQDFIQFCNEFLYLKKEMSDALWYKDNTIVVTKICTLADDISNVVCDILK
ncbi:hypothetical protein U9M48_029097, partial [Paspalum notatum var. saurae]